MTQHGQHLTVTTNPHAWRNACMAAAAVWLVLTLSVILLTSTTTLALFSVGPVCMGAGAAAVMASRTRVRWPAALYPLVVVAVATVVNLPVLQLIL